MDFKQVRRFLSYVDFDGSGTVEFEEFVVLMERYLKVSISLSLSFSLLAHAVPRSLTFAEKERGSDHGKNHDPSLEDDPTLKAALRDEEEEERANIMPFASPRAQDIVSDESPRMHRRVL